MFEISVACKYLLPRRRQLSVSVISLISVVVIALVVWLVVVFFSVSEGLEKNWVNKLVSLTAPVRVTPTEAYYRSYYYQIDGLSESSDYSLKTIQEKLAADESDPYNPESDTEIPASWPHPDTYTEGGLKDPVKLLFSSIQSLGHIPGIRANDYEVTAVRLSLLPKKGSQEIAASIDYQVYVSNSEPEEKQFAQTLLSMRAADLSHFLAYLQQKSKTTESFKEELKQFFLSYKITSLSPSGKEWKIPSLLLPDQFSWKAVILSDRGKPSRALVPLSTKELYAYLHAAQMQGLQAEVGDLVQTHEKLKVISSKEEKELPQNFPIFIPKEASFQGFLDPHSIDKAKKLDELVFSLHFRVQGELLSGLVPLKGLEFHSYKKTSKDFLPLEAFKTSEEAIFLPKSIKEAGTFVGDLAFLSYLAPTASTTEEEKIPVRIAGFYDPGIIPIGGKFVLASRTLTQFLHAAHANEQTASISNGVNIRFHNIQQAPNVKKDLQEALKARGVDHYWKVQTYQDFEFTKEILQELQSQKNLFSLIALVILVIACSNIISMLIILVNDKKTEIGILRSMGASSKSIATIFSLSGAIIGALGSFLGIIAGVVTLHYIQEVSTFLSYLQGHEMFNSSLYGELLPNTLSLEALSYVVVATVVLSFFAGLVPALKASFLQPTQIFRGSGG